MGAGSRRLEGRKEANKTAVSGYVQEADNAVRSPLQSARARLSFHGARMRRILSFAGVRLASSPPLSSSVVRNCLRRGRQGVTRQESLVLRPRDSRSGT
jgi:hypothetical protein